jgi:hypothetical protein
LNLKNSLSSRPLTYQQGKEVASYMRRSQES